MSSSGKMAADKHKSKYKPPSTVKQSQCTNSQRIHKRVHVQHIHETFPTKSWSFQDTTHIHVHVGAVHAWGPFLPRADPSRIQLNSTMQASHPLSRSASLLSFLQRKRIQSDHSEHVQTRVNLELASGWQTNYQLFSLLHKLPGINKIYRPWTPSKEQETDPFHSTQ